MNSGSLIQYTHPMLSELSIRNFATVEALQIEFKPGMSVITGETGAGKSVILGALSLSLGDRADKATVRSGAKKAELSAEFNIGGIAPAQAWLHEHDLDHDESHTCILRRVITNDGRSKGYINGSPVTMASLKSLGEMLIDIHSQHEHQSLLHKATHLRMLDDFSVDKDLISKLRSTWKQWQQNHQQMQQLQSASEESSAQSQLLSYQLTELEEMEIGDNEVDELDAEFKALNSADSIITSIQTALNLCSEDDEHNAVSSLSTSLATLKEIPSQDEKVRSIIGLLENAEIQLAEAVAELRDFNDEFSADPQRLETINNRLSDLYSVARKHKINAKELPVLVADLQSQLARFSNSDEELKQLQANDEMLRSQYQKIGNQVSSSREKGASRLAEQVNSQLANLGMPNASITVALRKNSNENPSHNGLESAEFLVSTNPGSTPQALGKIASGGELSRISLAIQVITAQTTHTPILVFDEVDVGIGGGVAKVVGELLRELGKTTQIFCVTHQAQVASQGHNHFFVSKSSGADQTQTAIVELGETDTIKEIARMLGGDDFTDESLAHAKQLVNSA
ncbi:MAG: DNA repair protein RecN [Pseudohongiellaceae bacterium]